MVLITRGSREVFLPLTRFVYYSVHFPRKGRVGPHFHATCKGLGSRLAPPDRHTLIDLRSSPACIMHDASLHMHAHVVFVVFFFFLSAPNVGRPPPDGRRFLLQFWCSPNQAHSLLARHWRILFLLVLRKKNEAES